MDHTTNVVNNQAGTEKPKGPDFWKAHEETARLARLTQAAAIIFSGVGDSMRNTSEDIDHIVGHAFMLEKRVRARVEKEKEKASGQ
jgi:hypothetical protein